MALAKKSKQLAIWDVKKKKEIITKLPKSINIIIIPINATDDEIEQAVDSLIQSARKTRTTV